MDSEQREKINTFFVQTFNYILLCEERAITKRGLTNLSTKEAHVIAAAIGLAGEDRNIMSLIADELNISAGALSTSVNTLTRKGYLERVPSEKDRRIIFVRATDKGLDANRIHTEFHDDMLEHIANELDTEDIDVLTHSLERLSSLFDTLAHQQKEN